MSRESCSVLFSLSSWENMEWKYISGRCEIIWRMVMRMIRERMSDFCRDERRDGDEWPMREWCSWQSPRLICLSSWLSCFLRLWITWTEETGKSGDESKSCNNREFSLRGKLVQEKRDVNGSWQKEWSAYERVYEKGKEVSRWRSEHFSHYTFAFNE